MKKGERERFSQSSEALYLQAGSDGVFNGLGLWLFDVVNCTKPSFYSKVPTRLLSLLSTALKKQIAALSPEI